MPFVVINKYPLTEQSVLPHFFTKDVVINDNIGYNKTYTLIAKFP